MRAGMPINAGVSKDSKVRTNKMSSTEPAVGISKRKVTRLKVCQVLAPDIIADSSRDGSMDLKAAVIMRNANGTWPTE
jgi:hypothetical protein